MQEELTNISVKLSNNANDNITKFVDTNPHLMELRAKGARVNKHTILRSGILIIQNNPKLLTSEIALASQTEEGFDTAICGDK